MKKNDIGMVVLTTEELKDHPFLTESCDLVTTSMEELVSYLQENITSETVYLAGNISGTSYEEATEWRNYLKKTFPAVNWLDPMEGKDWLQDCESIGLVYPEMSSEQIFKRDLRDVYNADMLVIKLTKPSIGTCFEMGLFFSFY